MLMPMFHFRRIFSRDMLTRLHASRVSVHNQERHLAAATAATFTLFSLLAHYFAVFRHYYYYYYCHYFHFLIIFHYAAIYSAYFADAMPLMPLFTPLRYEDATLLLILLLPPLSQLPLIFAVAFADAIASAAMFVTRQARLCGATPILLFHLATRHVTWRFTPVYVLAAFDTMSVIILR